MVTVAYSGVHQAYQLALAAQEAQLLDRFYCSVIDAPEKWGHRVARVFGKSLLGNRRCESLDPNSVTELPGPFLLSRLTSKFSRNAYPWYLANFSFDRAVATRLSSSTSRIFVGTETCSRDSFRAAKRRNMRCMLDCPQVHPAYLTDLLNRAAEDLRLPPPAPFDPPELAERKAEEFELADYLFVISDLQRQTFLNAGFSSEKLIQIPLWADPSLWFPKGQPQGHPDGPLKVLFVGSFDLRKGIPYLLRAMEKCGDSVQLTLIGANRGAAMKYIRSSRAKISYGGSKTKDQLRHAYWDSDLLVLPSLVDTFGFVAMEAMACGRPVVVTENCGVPVPDPTWRVPIMDSGAIAKRLLHYVTNPEALEADAALAAPLSHDYTPQRYRTAAGKVFRTFKS